MGDQEIVGDLMLTFFYVIYRIWCGYLMLFRFPRLDFVYDIGFHAIALSCFIIVASDYLFYGLCHLLGFYALSEKHDFRLYNYKWHSYSHYYLPTFWQGNDEFLELYQQRSVLYQWLFQFSFALLHALVSYFFYLPLAGDQALFRAIGIYLVQGRLYFYLALPFFLSFILSGYSHLFFYRRYYQWFADSFNLQILTLEHDQPIYGEMEPNFWDEEEVEVVDWSDMLATDEEEQTLNWADQDIATDEPKPAEDDDDVWYEREYKE